MSTQLPYGRPGAKDAPTENRYLDERRRSVGQAFNWRFQQVKYTSNFVPKSWELCRVDTTSNTVTATLPTLSQNITGDRYRILKVAGSNYVKVTGTPLLGGPAYIWRTGDSVECMALHDSWVVLGNRPQLVDHVGQLDIVNSVAEETLYSVTIPGGLLTTVRGVRFHIAGDYLNNSGAGRTLQVRVLYDDTAMYDDTTAAITANALRTGFNINCILGAQGSTAIQTVTGDIRIGARTATVAGVGGLDTSAINVDCPFYGSAAENSDTDLIFKVTVTHAVADANLSLRRQYAFTEVLW